MRALKVHHVSCTYTCVHFHFVVHNTLEDYHIAQKLIGENFDEFDKSMLHCQNFPYQYFAILDRMI